MIVSFSWSHSSVCVEVMTTHSLHYICRAATSRSDNHDACHRMCYAIDYLTTLTVLLSMLSILWMPMLLIKYDCNYRCALVTVMVLPQSRCCAPGRFLPI